MDSNEIKEFFKEVDLYLYKLLEKYGLFIDFANIYQNYYNRQVAYYKQVKEK